MASLPDTTIKLNQNCYNTLNDDGNWLLETPFDGAAESLTTRSAAGDLLTSNNPGG